MTNSDNLRRLHFLNALFAGVTGHDLYLAQQIHAAIAASLAGSGGQPEATPASGAPDSDGGPGEPAFADAAARLLQRLCGGRQDHGFFHWDAAASAAGATPLFARECILAGLKRLARFPESTLLVTNLRPAHCPPQRRWTSRRQREYGESLALIRDLAAARSRRSASVNILFL